MKDIRLSDYHGLLMQMAWAYSRKYHIDFQETKSEAYMIFLRAVKTFDEAKNCRFSTHLYHQLRDISTYCRNEITHRNRAELTEDFAESIGLISAPPDYRDNYMDKFWQLSGNSLSGDAQKLMGLLLKRGQKIYLKDAIMWYKRHFNNSANKVTKAWKELKSFWRAFEKKVSPL